MFSAILGAGFNAKLRIWGFGDLEQLGLGWM